MRPALVIRSRGAASALAVIALAVLAAAPARGDDPRSDSRVEVGDRGELHIPGEGRPPAGARLPLPKVKRTAADRPIAIKPAAAGAAGAADAEQPPGERFSAIEFSGGYTVLPDSILSIISAVRTPGKAERDRHPRLQGVVIEGGYRMGVSDRSWLVVRGGITVPVVPDQNWWNSTGAVPPLYTSVGVVGIDATADYLRRFEITPTLGLLARAGLGLQIVAGGATQAETLPNCAKDKAPTCATWRTVGRQEVWLPPVLPAVRASAGLDVRLSRELALWIEGGLRSAPWLGAGFSWRL